MVKKALFIFLLIPGFCHAGGDVVVDGRGSGSISVSHTGSGSVSILRGVSTPINFAYTAASTDTLSSSWTGFGTPVADNYTVNLSTNSDFSNPVTSSTTANQAVTLPSLSVNTTYYERVRANSGTLVSPWSSNITTPTLANIPLTETSTWTFVGGSSLAFQWSNNSNPLSVTRYVSELSTASNFTGLINSATVYTLTSTHTSLSSNTVYYGRVKAVNHSQIDTSFLTVGSTQTDAGSDIALVGVTSTSTATNSTDSQSVSFTQNSASNRLGIASIAMFQNTGNTPSVTSASWGGQAMVRISSTIFSVANTRIIQEMWYIREANLPSDGAITVTFTLSLLGGSTEKAMGAALFSNVEQATTWRDVDSSTGTGTTPSLTLTTVAGDVVVDSLNSYSGTPTIGADQSALFSAVGAGTVTDCTASTELATGVSATMSWTLTSQEYAYCAATMMKQ